MQNLHVPASVIGYYKSIEPWKFFTNIVVIDYILTYVIDGETYKSYKLTLGTEITPEPEPAKEGFVFSGWSEIPATMPAHDVTIIGSFIIDQYTLTYKVDGQTYKTSSVTYGTALTAEAAPTKEGYTFSGWSEIPATMPAHDVTITGFFTINQYTLTYLVDGEIYKTYLIDYGTPITVEAEPTKEGYLFSGWSELLETMPAHDVVVTGSFTNNSKCDKPWVVFEDGKLKFSCATEGSTCISTITDDDIGTYIGNERKLSATYRIRYYAMAKGYRDSESSTAVLHWLDYAPSTIDLEEVETTETTPPQGSGRKCDKPSVIYENGTLKFSCATVGATFVSTITDEDIKTYISNEVELSVTYYIKFYAMAKGYEDSDPTTVILRWLPYVPITVGMEEVESEELRMKSEEWAGAEYYDLNGRRFAKPQKGMNIVRSADGSVRKIVKR